MKPTRLALGVLAAALSAPVFALPTAISLYGASPTTTGGAGTSNGTVWNNSDTAHYGYAGAGGSNYGNTYSWASGSFGASSPSVKMAAWGSSTFSSAIKSAWIGNYGSSNGYGITSQESGELTASHDPDASSPNYEHAIDNYTGYESMMFTFGSAVTLNSVSIGFKGGDSDATVLVYTGAGDPTASLTTRTYSDLLSNGWQIAGNLFDMSTSSANSLSTSLSSKYWMVGAYMSTVGGNAALGNDTKIDSFKITGLGITPRVVPEPDSVALIGLASLGLVLARRKSVQRKARG